MMMTFRQREFACPHCGAPAEGSQETIPGVALFGEPIPHGEIIQVDYFGETEVDWDNQRSIVDGQHRISLVCGNRHSWWARGEDPDSTYPADSRHDQLVSVLQIAIGIAHWAKDQGADRGFIDAFLKMANDLINEDD